MASAEKLVLIKKVMADLEYVWAQNADLRLGQLMENLYGCGVCMYAREDQLIAVTLREARDKSLVATAREIDSDVGK